MKKLTNKQRADIYLKAANGIFRHNDFCCHELKRLTPNKFLEIKLKELYPEFFLFEPAHNPGSGNRWWSGTPYCGEDMNNRILALLFAHQMVLNP